MRKILSIGLISAIAGLSASTIAQAQPAASGAPMAAAPAAAAPADAAPAAAVKSGPPSVDWPISDLLADAPSKAVLGKDLPALLTYDGLDQIKGMSIRQISQFPQANSDAAKLAQIQTDLTAAAAPAK
jgi:hypothetical protein